MEHKLEFKIVCNDRLDRMRRVVSQTKQVIKLTQYALARFEEVKDMPPFIRKIIMDPILERTKMRIAELRTAP